MNAWENKKHLISLIDLTSLSDSDNEQTIEVLCEKAATRFGSVAAVCVLPRFVKLAKRLLKDKPISVATVANFPSGGHKFIPVLTEVDIALTDGVNEIDVVIPYREYLQGHKHITTTMVKLCKKFCGSDVLLKVILETGALTNKYTIYDISCDVLDAGADFIKTSTGKIEVGATLEAAQQMLEAIKQVNPDAGLKISGGIKTPEQAQSYVDLAHKIMGNDWNTSKHLRIGASSLLDSLLT